MLTSTRGVELLGIETQYVGIDVRAQNFFHTGMISLQNQKYQNAIAQYTEMLSLDPNSLPGLINAGNAFAKIRNFEKAIKRYKRVLKLDKNNVIINK